MCLDEILDDFCNKYGYTGRLKYIAQTNKYRIVLNKGGNNAGVLITNEEYQSLTIKRMQDIINVLHYGFQEN